MTIGNPSLAWDFFSTPCLTPQPAQGAGGPTALCPLPALTPGWPHSCPLCPAPEAMLVFPLCVLCLLRENDCALCCPKRWNSIKSPFSNHPANNKANYSVPPFSWRSPVHSFALCVSLHHSGLICRDIRQLWMNICPSPIQLILRMDWLMIYPSLNRIKIWTFIWLNIWWADRHEPIEMFACWV